MVEDTANGMDFEKPIRELEAKIESLRHTSSEDGLDVMEDVARLSAKLEKQMKAIYAKLTPWQKVQVARHPSRPHFCDYVNGLFSDFTPLAGDRLYGEDAAIVGGLARFLGQSVVVIGHEKGNDTEMRIRHNFGMAKPEGYRKAKRLMELASKFKIPVITLVDTAGAYPGVDAEERGQGVAIAESIETCLEIEVPLVSAIIGEGGSGGAIALSAADRVLMLEHSIYSVISPEGCASILWRDKAMTKTAAEALHLTAQDLLSFGIIDEIVAEPVGGAHRNPEEMVKKLGSALDKNLGEIKKYSGARLKAMRREKFLKLK
jgi:acetyl-CoA carboxylase carboxyl transferase subunit alpha